jgi:uncharacterized protein YecE (DUF72 family)
MPHSLGVTSHRPVLRIGTSGFDYRDWRGAYYPRSIRPTDRLAYYAQHFDAVELNVTFYRMPAADAFWGWRDAVPDDFRFAVKASRYLTHTRRLLEPERSVDYLMERAGILGDRLGVVLIQLPPSLEHAPDRLDRTLQAFGRRVPVAVELRHRSWFVDETWDLLRNHRAAFVLADRRGPTTPLVTPSPWTYLRLHEGRSSPRPCYGIRALRSWASRLAELGPAGADGWVFFNNDHRACAIANAAQFRELVADRTTMASSQATAGHTMGSLG